MVPVPPNVNYKITFPTTFVYEEVTAYEIIQVTKLLPNSNLCGHDGLSST